MIALILNNYMKSQSPITKPIFESKYYGPCFIQKKNKKLYWDQQEDQVLFNLVHKTDSRKEKYFWSYISKIHFEHMKNYSTIQGEFKPRTAKQCRERYLYHMSKPSKTSFKVNEEQLTTLLKLNNAYGNKWSLIASKANIALNDYDIKNIYYSLYRKLVRMVNSKLDSIECYKGKFTYMIIYNALKGYPILQLTSRKILEQLNILGNNDLLLLLKKSLEKLYIKCFKKIIQENKEKREESKTSSSDNEVEWHLNGEILKYKIKSSEDAFINYSKTTCMISNHMSIDKEQFGIESSYIFLGKSQK